MRPGRLAISRILGRPLSASEVVHHINGKEEDNRLENLMLFKNNRDHLRYEWGYNILPTWSGSETAKGGNTLKRCGQMDVTRWHPDRYKET